MTRGQDGRGDPAALTRATSSSPPAASFDGTLNLLRKLAADDDDPLGVMARCARHRWTAALLVDSRCLYEQALARMARASASIGPPPWPDHLVEEVIARALQDLLTRDHEDEIRGVPDLDPSRSSHAFMTLWFGIEPGMARTAAVRFNGLPERTRRVFFAFVLDRRSVDECISQGLGSRSTIRDALQSASRALFFRLGEQEAARGGLDS